MNSPKVARLRGLVCFALLTGLLAGCTSSSAEAEEGTDSSAAASSSSDSAESAESASAPAATRTPEPSKTPSPKPSVPPREMESWQLQVGDCFSEHAGGEEDVIETVDVVPCEQAHISEVYASYELPAGEFPGDSIDTTAGSFCEDEFEQFVGRPFAKSHLQATFIVPTEETWTMADDREVLCAVMGPFETEEEGSFKDSKR